MKIAILYSQPAENAAADDLDSLVQVEAVDRALTALGHAPERVGATLDLAAARRELLAVAPDVVFNLVEALEGHDRLLAAAPLLLDAMGLPYAGSRATATIETTNKLLAKRRMLQAGLPTPEWVELVDPGSVTPNANLNAGFIPGRYILKSVWEHASFGMDATSVVEAADAAALCRALAKAAPRLGGEAFAERYVEGREFNLGLLAEIDHGVAASAGPELLPPAEIRFVDWEAGRPKLVDWRAKWDEASPEYRRTVRGQDFGPEDAPLLAELGGLARRCWRLFGLGGWARVDFRVDEAGRPWILEVNANPCLSPDAGFAAALARAGIPFEAAIARILAGVEN